jgi:hypothetical protein
MHEILMSVAKLMAVASHALRPHLAQVALAIAATLLAIFGSDINGAIKGVVKDYHFLVRLAIFVFLVAFGYGAVSLTFAHVLTGLLGQIDDFYLAPLVVLVFVLIGALAEHRRNI